MNRIAFWASMVLVSIIADQARSADNGIEVLEMCFKASRLADTVCASPDNPPQQRLDCLKKAQAEQLVCLEHFSSQAAGTTPSIETPGAGSSQSAANQPETTTGVPVQAPVPASPPPVATALPETPPAAMAAAAATAIAPPNAPAETAGTPAKPSIPDWTVTETTSPIDYSPVVVATIRSSTDRENAPNTLSIQCRQRRPEMALRTDGAWQAGPNNTVQVALQMKDRSPWTLSADGKVATNTNDAIDLMQQLSEGTTVFVTVSDGVDHAATFHLAGLDNVRKKILTACRSTPITESKASLMRR